MIDFRKVHVLVVNGASRTVPYRDETFFLRAALQPEWIPPRITPTYVKPDELTPRQLEVVDVVVLANVAELDRTQVDALAAWVAQEAVYLLLPVECNQGHVQSAAWGLASLADKRR